MTLALYWRPRSRDGRRVGGPVLRDLIAPMKHLGWEKHSMYLRGLQDGGVEGAEELLEKLEQFGELEVWKE